MKTIINVKHITDEKVELILENGNTVTRKLYTKGRQFVDFVFYYKGIGYTITLNNNSEYLEFKESNYYTIMK